MGACALGRGKEGNHMIGISYLTDPVAQSMAQRIETMVQDRRYDHVFWEDAFFCGKRDASAGKDCPGKELWWRSIPTSSCGNWMRIRIS